MKKRSINKIVFYLLCTLFFLWGICNIHSQTTGEVYYFGDVDNSQSVTIVDALLVAQYYVNIQLENFNENTADVNIDLTIGIVDALLIAQKYVGLIQILPGEEKYEEYQNQLDSAKENWQDIGVSYYEYIYRPSCFCVPEMVQENLVEVQYDTIVSILRVQDDVYVPDAEYPNYFTINGLFDHIQTVIDKKEHIRDLEFHQTYFYPTVISVDPLILYIDDEYTYYMSMFRTLNQVQIISAGTDINQGDPFNLMSAQVTGDILTITIQHSGGCMEHIMEVYVLDAFLESYPPQADCYIYHDDPGDPCDAIVPTTDGFDLLPLADLYISSYGAAGPLILNLYSFDGVRLQVDYNIN